jgi:glycosyltransferase involved in cell wall biosynthesis
VHVIPHGVLRPWEAANGEPPGAGALEQELDSLERPLVLFFGLLRPYKGLDVLLEAWRGIDVAALWIAGMPRMDIAPLRAAAPPGVRFIPRFITDAELHALLRRARLTVLPYREIDQSGALFTALGAGSPLVLSDAGGFPELAATGAARTFPVGDADALRGLLRELLGDDGARAQMASAASALATGPYSWATIARQTLSLYETLVSR